MSMFSNEHKLYLKMNRIRRIKIICFQIIIVLLFLLLWEILARKNIINDFLFSSPTKIINTFISLFQNGSLFRHIKITIIEIIISFFSTSTLSFFIAAVMWWFPTFYKVCDPYITIMNSLPKVALGPLIIIWFGAGFKSIIFMALTISIFTSILNMYQAFINTNDSYILMAKSFRASKWQTFIKIIFPASISDIIVTLKINISMCLIGVIMGELLVSKEGLGYLIMYGSQVFQLDLVISSIFILGVVSFISYFLISILSLIIKKNNTN